MPEKKDLCIWSVLYIFLQFQALPGVTGEQKNACKTCFRSFIWGKVTKVLLLKIRSVGNLAFSGWWSLGSCSNADLGSGLFLPTRIWKWFVQDCPWFGAVHVGRRFLMLWSLNVVAFQWKKLRKRGRGISSDLRGAIFAGSWGSAPWQFLKAGILMATLLCDSWLQLQHQDKGRRINAAFETHSTPIVLLSENCLWFHCQIWGLWAVKSASSMDPRGGWAHRLFLQDRV